MFPQGGIPALPGSSSGSGDILLHPQSLTFQPAFFNTVNMALAAPDRQAFAIAGWTYMPDAQFGDETSIPAKLTATDWIVLLLDRPMDRVGWVGTVNPAPTSISRYRAWQHMGYPQSLPPDQVALASGAGVPVARSRVPTFEAPNVVWKESALQVQHPLGGNTLAYVLGNKFDTLSGQSGGPLWQWVPQYLSGSPYAPNGPSDEVDGTDVTTWPTLVPQDVIGTAGPPPVPGVFPAVVGVASAEWDSPTINRAGGGPALSAVVSWLRGLWP